MKTTEMKKHLSILVNQFLTIIFFSLLLFSCVTPKKMDAWIGEYQSVPNKFKSSDYIIIKTENISHSDSASVSQKGESKFIPAIFYWKSQQSVLSNLNPNIPVNNISSTIINYANAKGLKKKLNGQKIELSLGKVPSVFTMTHKYQMFFFVVFYVQSEYFYLTPQKQDITVAYRILNDNSETKKGTITVADPSKKINQKIFQSVKKMTWTYLDQYDITLKDMSKELVDKLLLQL